LFLPAHALAYQPTWADIVDQFQDKLLWARSIYSVQVQIFDPFEPNADGSPRELPERGFQQKVHWKVDEYLTVETQDEQQRLLHYLYEVEGTRVSAQIATGRQFSEQEVRPLYFSFFTKSLDGFRWALEQAGVASDLHYWHLAPDGNVYHRLGHAETGAYLLMSTSADRLLSIHWPFTTPDGRQEVMSAQFSEFEEYRNQLYPKVTAFYLGDRLFMRKTITEITEPVRLPWRRLKQLAEDYRPQETVSLGQDFQN
jgi:hypothetical protein